MLQDHLALAERHVAQGHTHIQRQRAIVTELTCDGHIEAAITAAELLALFEETEAFHIAHRDRLLKELAGNSN